MSFAILALFLAAGLTALSVAIRGDRQATFVSMATLLAKSKLAAAGVDFPFRPGSTGSTFSNGYVWRAEVRRHATAHLAAEPPVEAFWVDVTVVDPQSNGGRRVTLGTLVLARGLR